MKFSVFFPLCMFSATLAANLEAKTGSPVEKVVTLLKDMKTKLAADAKVEYKAYNKYACYCEKVLTAKAPAIDAGYAEMRRLSQEILKYRGMIAILKAEIAELGATVSENIEGQGDATNIRGKENAAFVAETAEIKEGMASVQKAIKVLADATLPAGSGALVQQGTMAQSRLSVKAALETLPARVSVPIERLSLLNEFSRDGSQYAPQSATVQGILVDMYTTFAKDLEAAYLEEGTKNRQYEEYIANAEQEQTETEEAKADKEASLAAAQAALAEAEQAYDAVMKEREADVEFFDKTKEACISKYEEYTERKRLRTDELAGVKEAINILSSDEARETFQSSMKVGSATFFLQTSSTVNAAPVAKAYAAVKSLATHSHSLRFAALAIRIRATKVGHFEEVLKEIDSLMAILKEEGAADIEKKDQCKDEFQTVKGNVAKSTWKASVNDATITKLDSKIEALTTQIAETLASLAEAEAHMTALKAARQEEHDAFLDAKKDDEDAIALLVKAKDALMDYYKKNDIMLIAVSQHSNSSIVQPPDATFSDKGSRSTMASSIVSLLDHLIEDGNNELATGASAEEAQMIAFNEELAACMKLCNALKDKKVELESMKADAQKAKNDELSKKEDNMQDIEDEEAYLKKIKPDCDWLLGAFDERAKARAAEMKGLTDAKAYLAGYQADLLQKTSTGFDDSRLANIRFLGMRS